MAMGLVIRFDAYLMIVMLMGLGNAIGLSNGYKFYVGGRDGWILTPSEDYSHCSHRNRFQVNDTLYFKYAKEKDSVLETETLSLCLTAQVRFFFISGSSEKCPNGQKLAVKVMPTVPVSHPFPVTDSFSSPSGFDVSSAFSTRSEAFAPAPGPVRARNNAGSIPNALSENDDTCTYQFQVYPF
ncbi:hypothetical protein HID58_012826 [Brassica napus]|uniref:Phytocyanin domain-containing protein n=1 Tax=Brassica napus TaxID=3708 RepID=A0ABQ8E255_BRANA|nr:hypothetical protein HID58_012826 [Brassica napus]